MSGLVRRAAGAGLVAVAVMAGGQGPATATTAPDRAVVEVAVATVADPTTTTAARKCYISRGTHHAKTLLGATFYKFNQRADWCTEGGRVIGVHYREHTFTEASAFAQFRGLTEDFVTPIPAGEATSVKKATVENCVPVQGCISVKYPFVRLVLRGDGTAYPVTGE